tara:strand:+ start:9375 stop:9722 length:348 start_codon:yes stop_codon:yes gene_type:complete
MTENEIRVVTDLDEVIFLLNHGVPIFMDLACNIMNIDDEVLHFGKSPFYLAEKPEQDFDSLCEAGAIAILDTGKPYLVKICLWDIARDGEQSKEAIAMAKKFDIGEEFVDFAVKR